MNFRILKSFTVINKNYLKNILKKFFVDNFIWQQFEKMFSCQMLDISRDELIYARGNTLGKSFLSAFLLNIYIRELDDFIYFQVVKLCF